MKHIDKLIEATQEVFNQELRTDENKDYRRGYYAGQLVSLLWMKGFLKEEVKEID